MTDWIFPTAFSSWTHGDGSPESAAIDRVLASGRYSMGLEVEAFEEEFAAYHSRRHCITVNSGSSANLVAVAALSFLNRIPKASRVMVPAIAWATTYAPLRQVLTAHFVVQDTDDTWNAPFPGLGFASAAVCCPVLGNPAHLEAWRSSINAMPLIEDCCESLGARTVTGRLAGTFGDLSTFSFFYSHQLSAVEGGAILTDDDQLARACRLLRNHGNEGWGAKEFEDQYSFIAMGYNLRWTEIYAAVAREQLKKLDAMNNVRRFNLDYFAGKSSYSDLPIRLQHQMPSSDPAPFGLAFECATHGDRSRLAKALRLAGIDCRLPTGGSFLRHRYGGPWHDQETPRADRIHETGMFLGNAPFPIGELIDKAVSVMRSVL